MKRSPNSLIKRAIVPAAGLGTRLRPLTRAIPKEMLPLGRKPVLEYVVDELRACGIQRILFVVSPGKEMIRAYFGDGERFGLNCDYVIQPEMRGLGDAVLHGEDWAGGEPVVVAFGDCVIEPASAPPLARVMGTHVEMDSEATVLCEHVPLERASNYGILAPATYTGDTMEPFRLAGVIEKPRPEEAPSRFAVAARWALGSGVFEVLRVTPPAYDGELNLTDAICEMIQRGARAYGVPLRPGEARGDIGGWQSYLTAAARYAALDTEYGDLVRADINGIE